MPMDAALALALKMVASSKKSRYKLRRELIHIQNKNHSNPLFK
jgi:hypothetical protein